MSIAATTDLETAPANPLMLPLVAATACAALADWLFFGWPIGISLALFYGVIGVVAVAVNDVRATRGVQIIMTSVFIAGLLALIEDVSLLSVILGSLATASFVIVMTAREAASWQRQLLRAALVPVARPVSVAGRYHWRASAYEKADAGMAGIAGGMDRAAGASSRSSWLCCRRQIR